MKLTRQIGRGGALVAVALAAVFVLVSGNSTAGIADTKHNLGSGPAAAAAGRVNNVTDTAEICVFCHTPHAADISAPTPLWNKRLNTGATYTTYASLNTPSLDGTVAPVGSVSLACLSCHDGTQAMDNIINAPGSGGIDVTGGGTGGRAFTWSTAVGATANAAGNLASGAGLIGNDLSNDHPVGIQYCGGATVGTAGLTGAGTVVSGTCKDSDFNLPQTALINNAQVFWVDTGGTGKQRTDLPLYPRATFGPLVECATCHDPHVSTGQAGPTGTTQVAGATFLRISNASSAVCTACHVK
jgi:hypothetical protein